MNSTPTTSNSSAKFKGSKIPTLKGNALNVQKNTSTRATKISFEKGKSAGELKQRLASAVSAKIAAANKDGRTLNNNRGIGYLLQRKQQQDSKLNTKTLSLQKPLRNRNDEATKGGRTEAKNGSDLRDGTNGLSQPSARKSLLSALMSSRMPSGTLQGKQSATEAKLDTSGTTRKTTAGEQTTRSGDKQSTVGKPLPSENAGKVGDSGSRNPSNLLQVNKEDKSFADTVRVTSYESTADKTSSNLNSRNNSLSKPSDNVNPEVTDRKRTVEKKPPLEGENHSSKQQPLETESGRNVLKNPKRTLAPQENSPLRKMSLGKNSATSSKHDRFREDLLEKLEAEVGSCKIAAFQNMEDFSVLRMRVYRIRGELEQLKKERAKRTLV